MASCDKDGLPMENRLGGSGIPMKGRNLGEMKGLCRTLFQQMTSLKPHATCRKANRACYSDCLKFKGGFKVSSGTVEWYISSYGADFDSSETASPGKSA